MFHLSLHHFTFQAELRDALKNLVLSIWEGIDRGDDEKGQSPPKNSRFLSCWDHPLGELV